LAPDDKRFAIIPELKASAEEKGDVHVTFLENFFDELRRRTGEQISLTPGTKLGPYEIVAPIGAGAWAKCIARKTPS
jgi:hypothetical protein